MKLLAQIDFKALKESFPSGSMPSKQTLDLGFILSSLLPYLFVFAGLALLVYLILGGFQLLTSRGDPKAVDSAKGKITSAVIGFLIIFVSYWLMQIVEVIFGLPEVF